MPAQKKHPSTRARRNVASSASVLSEVENPDVPALPERDDEDGWSPLTVAWWNDIWSSPMSEEYHASDKHQIIVLAMLMNDFFTATSRTMRAAISAEIRQHRTAFGMTPYDRRRLEWTIEQAEESKDRGQRRRDGQGTAPRSQPKPGDDPRRHLSAV